MEQLSTTPAPPVSHPTHRHRTVWFMVLILLCVVVVGLARYVTRPQWHTGVDIGNEPPFILEGETATFQNFIGFNNRETWHANNEPMRVFRWTTARATVTFPAAMRMSPIVLSFDAFGYRPNSQQPFTRLVLNSVWDTTISVADEWRTYHILVPDSLLPAHADYSLITDFRSPTWVDATHRTLGIALDTINVRELAPQPIASWAACGIVVVAMLFVGVMCMRRSWHQALLKPLLLGAGWLLMNTVYQPQLLPRDVVSNTFLGGLLLLWWNDSTHRTTPVVAITRTLYTCWWLVVALWLALSPQLIGYWLIDDTYISMRYAQQLVHGHGLVFNAGEYVEGYTNFLWTMMIALALVLHIDPILWVVTLTFVLAFGIVALIMIPTYQFVPARWQWVVALLLVLSTPFLIYTTRGGGMETALFAALLVATYNALLAHAWARAGLLSALTMMTRPDGAVLVGVAVLFLVWYWWQKHDHRPLLRYIVVFATLFGTYFAWRWHYYSYPLPNTFYAKVGTTWAQVLRGITYAQLASIEHPLLLASILGIVLGMWQWRTLAHHLPTFVVTASFVALFSAYAIGVGGDWMPGARFFMPLLPFGALLSMWGIATIAHVYAHNKIIPVLLITMTGVIVIAQLCSIPHYTCDTYSPVWVQYYAVRRYRETGRWINDNTPPNTLLATARSGAVPYYAQRTTIDIWGLTDEHIAHLPIDTLGSGKAGHEKTDVDYVLSRKPDIIPYDTLDLFDNHPLFEAHYALHNFHGAEGRAVKLYVREGAPIADDEHFLP